MQQSKNANSQASELAIAVPNAKSLAVLIARFSVLLSVAVFAPALGSQAVTGTLVNAALFASVALLGLPAALLIGIIPSAISAATGALAPALAAMVPFIILSNGVLVLVFTRLGKDYYWRGALLAAFVKFAFLSGVGSFLIGYFVPTPVASNLAVILGLPQLYTALSGAMLAFVVLKISGKDSRS